MGGIEACASVSARRGVVTRDLMRGVTTVSSVCPKCGIAAKSGKISCCGNGGSWFGKCGSARNAKFDHTFYEGIEACASREPVTRDIFIRNTVKPISWASNTTRQGHVSQHRSTAYDDTDGASNAASATANGYDR